MFDWDTTLVSILFYIFGVSVFIYLGSGYIGFTVGCFLGWAITQFFIYKDKKRHEK